MNIHVLQPGIHVPQIPHHGCSEVYMAKQAGKCSVHRLLLVIPPDPDKATAQQNWESKPIA